MSKANAVHKIDPKIKSALSSFGLTDNEITVYTAALKTNETSPYALAKATGVPRTTVYDILTSLSLKGLVELKQSDGFQKQQTKIKAKNPSVLRTILHQKRQDLTRTEVNLVSILPLLKGDYLAHTQSADFQFLPGAEGVREVYFHQSPSTETKIVFENMMPMDVFGSQDMNQYSKTETDQNLTKAISHRELIPLTDWTKHVVSYQYSRDPNYIKGRQIRYIDNPVFNNHLSITAQGKRVHICAAHKDEVYGLKIKSQTLADTMQAIFNLLWPTATPITPEVIESWGENEYYSIESDSRSTTSGSKSSGTSIGKTPNK